MDLLKNAFQKIKQDMDFLFHEINNLKIILNENDEKINKIYEILKKNDEKIMNLMKNNEFSISTNKLKIPTNSTHSSTNDLPLEGLNSQNITFSTGNQGVSTDRQTNQQTDKHPLISYGKNENSIENAVEMLDSLDNIKKQIRLKFKKLTQQEFLVFSTIYQLNEEKGYSDYQMLSSILNLSESSIRDYVGRIIKKGISVEKRRINNKNIQLFIPESLKKVASLPTIFQLREL